MNIGTSYYVNPNTQGLTSNLKNTAIKDKHAFDSSMQHLLNPVEDLVQVLKTPINLATTSSINRASNSIDIAEGKRIAINDGYVLTVKKQGVEVRGGDDPYDLEAYEKAQGIADSLSELLRNAGGTMKTVAFSKEEYAKWTENVASALRYAGIDPSRDFTVNGMKYSKNENGWYESSANSEAKAAYEQMKANNRTFEFADERTRKQIEYISSYYLENVPDSVKNAWKETLEETGVNPFQIGFQSTLTQLSVEQDFRTGGNDDLLGDSVESCSSAINSILERINNPLGEIDEKRATYLSQEKEFYSRLYDKISGVAETV